MADKLNSIIDSIELKVQYEFDKNPVCIYIGIGTCAGLIKIDQNGMKTLDDENYHQFPPALQKLYRENQNMYFCCILIDPFLENPVFITQDRYLRQKLFNDKPWKSDDDNFCYQNTRINIYPFRHSIKVKNTQREIEHNYIDITEHIDRLHKLCITHNILYVYHDFSGTDYVKYIESYFINSIRNNLDHIIYGFGSGYITGCYYDFRNPESHFACIHKNNENRILISVFNISNIISQYNKLQNYEKENITFTDYMNHQIQQYNLEDIDIIMSQIKIYLDSFVYDFRNYILSLLRYFHEIGCEIISGKEPEFNSNFYGLIILNDLKIKIKQMCALHDVHFFKKTKELIAEKYKIQLEMLMNGKNKLSPIEIMNIITSSEKKYEWHDIFNKMIL